jgi:hypothetical protein
MNRYDSFGHPATAGYRYMWITPGTLSRHESVLALGISDETFSHALS